MKRALISVYDKEGVVELAEQLIKHDIEIISTGGTYQHLLDNGVPVLEVSQVIESDEMLDGRVKTLHPYIHGGILAIRDNAEHMQTLREKNIATIDFVIVNLYPFFDKVKENLPFDDTIEFIDIGGPTMLRSAAKSFKDVVVITDKKDYQIVIDELNNSQTISYETRKFFAKKVFNLTACYDAAISQFLLDDDCPEFLTISYQKESEMRYGENSHQKAVYYVDKMNDGAMKNFSQLNGKALSFNNIRDMDLAWKVVCEFNETEDTACCAVKHSTPCGVAIADSVETAYNKTYECDPVSIFGGIVAFNSEVDESTAKKLNDIFLEIVIAPSFSDNALTVLKQKKNLRVIKCNQKPQDSKEYIKVDGGLLVQDVNNALLDNAKVVTNKQPNDIENKDLLFALKVVKYVKSNAIVIAKDGQTLGIGGGEVSRIWATEKAIERANTFDKTNMVLASDAFFPFSDVVELVSENAITAIIQPGGSIRDQDSIDVCNKKDIAMVFSQLRHFKH
ncbi:bifunctional phosphoribosylaminoimidazolecarboxamide formyltransferase/IMP cyclohydrolase [Pasteurella atlantica]|uniref:Bifunctional phosphoribosylaminoimidazolecarboxamide formyltransferase/IMP cyclohydrolase n=2 Tax=Pasteurellaceae TaxID=712 RepID=A0ACC6HLC7_9PAST|nr:bifunctional phosphoribosylaminoimidazolecarboxamide formyltransferase/IMP cyclohydrolase [Pasteurella atlantica]MDP8033437.1 bifunctional phosphoribosylaminoimidazolecarboxamide formyltransferase/IMP cyclohydrolase [Pasteurella atlantica]MDP8035373.1 bifunctional phosphoribosylaminoimidazolecarboxamide formyltransferase/IMP cyclohydrolase [Pasteurella atlantica]MDP8037323.1 bifunctional phosphoribosylaminoimidazolecarboxamide formyltransferase/IMP cyclohydrolase [Pasteurella atlantica]MDP80